MGGGEVRLEKMEGMTELSLPQSFLLWVEGVCLGLGDGRWRGGGVGGGVGGEGEGMGEKEEKGEKWERKEVEGRGGRERKDEGLKMIWAKGKGEGRSWCSGESRNKENGNVKCRVPGPTEVKARGGQRRLEKKKGGPRVPAAKPP